MAIAGSAPKPGSGLVERDTRYSAGDQLTTTVAPTARWPTLWSPTRRQVSRPKSSRSGEEVPDQRLAVLYAAAAAITASRRQPHAPKVEAYLAARFTEADLVLVVLRRR